LTELLKQLEDDYDNAGGEEEKDAIVEFAVLLLVGFLLGLRGEEIMKTDISGLLKYLDVGAGDETFPHVVVPLIGRLKGELGERYHMLIMARVTRSGIQAEKWMDRLCLSLVRRDMWNGFVFQGKKGQQRKIGSYDSQFVERLERVQETMGCLFEPGIDVADAYGLRRSLRRGSTTEAGNLKIDERVVNMNNRWRKWEEARGRRPSMTMASHYTEVRLSLPVLWEYSYSF